MKSINWVSRDWRGKGKAGNPRFLFLLEKYKLGGGAGDRGLVEKRDKVEG